MSLLLVCVWKQSTRLSRSGRSSVACSLILMNLDPKRNAEIKTEVETVCNVKFCTREIVFELWRFLMDVNLIRICRNFLFLGQLCLNLLS